MKVACMIITAILLAAIPLSLWSQGAPNGVDIYKTRCAACHGSRGEGLPAVKIPAVTGTPLTVTKIVSLITTGEGGKTVHATPIVNINKDEAKAIADYVKSFK
jgi:mono/diheme cytochrome c family protein